MFRILIAATSATVMTLATQSHGMLITNVTTNTVIFNSGGFEGDTPNANPADASPGSYQYVATKDLVRDAAAPGAYTGTQYLETSRDASGSGHARFIYSVEPSVGDTVRAEFMLYSETGDNRINWGAGTPPTDLATTYRGSVRINASGTFMYINPTTPQTGAWTVASSTTITRGVWQHWIMEYTVGSGQFSVSIDGSTPEVFPTMTTADAGSYTRFFSIANAGNGKFYIDSVLIPEPASLSLLALGGLLMMRRRSLA